MSNIYDTMKAGAILVNRNKRTGERFCTVYSERHPERNNTPHNLSDRSLARIERWAEQKKTTREGDTIFTMYVK